MLLKMVKNREQYMSLSDRFMLRKSLCIVSYPHIIVHRDISVCRLQSCDHGCKNLLWGTLYLYMDDKMSLLVLHYKILHIASRCMFSFKESKENSDVI